MPGKEEQGAGRLPENKDQEARPKGARDISEIDCQEGTMERGETGGNFQTANNETRDNEKNPQ